MIELNKKHVIHIPLHKFEDKTLKKIYISQPLEKLDKMLQEEGYTSYYKTKVQGFYKGRSFDELLITIFSSEEDNRTGPDEIFIKWFKNNNHLLKQESFAYEEDNSLKIIELK